MNCVIICSAQVYVWIKEIYYIILQYYMLEIINNRAFPAKNITLQSLFINSLAVFVRLNNQAKNAVTPNPSNKFKFFLNFMLTCLLTDVFRSICNKTWQWIRLQAWFFHCLMPFHPETCFFANHSTYNAHIMDLLLLLLLSSFTVTSTEGLTAT